MIFVVLHLPLSPEDGLPEGASLQEPLKVIMQNIMSDSFHK
jgi:hypothetical protein